MMGDPMNTTMGNPTMDSGMTPNGSTAGTGHVQGHRQESALRATTR